MLNRGSTEVAEVKRFFFFQAEDGIRDTSDWSSDVCSSDLAPMFHIIDFPLLFAAPAFGTYQVTIPKFSAQSFCEAVEREGVTHTVLVPTMINLLTQFPELEDRKSVV